MNMDPKHWIYKCLSLIKYLIHINKNYDTNNTGSFVCKFLSLGTGSVSELANSWNRNIIINSDPQHYVTRTFFCWTTCIFVLLSNLRYPVIFSGLLVFHLDKRNYWYSIFRRKDSLMMVPGQQGKKLKFHNKVI